MNYMACNYEQLGKKMNEYFEKIQRQIREKLIKEGQSIKVLNHGDFEIFKLRESNLKELYIENDKIHNLFSQNGCKVLGKLSIYAIAYPPGSNKNLAKPYCFVIDFKLVTVKFNYDNEDFSVDDEISINNIQLIQ